MPAKVPLRIATIVMLVTSGCGRSGPSPPEPPDASSVAGTAATDGWIRPVGTGTEPTIEPASGRLDPESGAANAADAASSSPAKQLIQRMVERYRQASAYRDDAVVRLAYLQSGVPETDEAPLRVRYEAQGRLRLTAYALDLACDGGRMEARVTGPTAGELQRQSLRRSLVGNPLRLEDLYADPAVLHFASAGLGGPSPQLELLLSPEPLAGLLAGHAELQLGPRSMIEEHPCQAVVIDGAPLRYVIWIDRRTLLIRRIELPLQQLPAATTAAPVEAPGLTIELLGAAFAREPRETYRLAADPDAVPVSRFVPRPPPLASDLIGRRPPTFQLHNLDKTVAVSQSGAAGKATVMLWVADHEGSKLAAEQLQTIADGLPEEARQLTQFLVVMAEPAAAAAAMADSEAAAESRSVQPTGDLLRQWENRLPWTDDTRAIGRDVFQIQTTPALCVVSATGHVQWFAHPAGPEQRDLLPSVLRDLAAGVDVGAAIRQQYDAAQQTFRQQLQQARLEDD